MDRLECPLCKERQHKGTFLDVGIGQGRLVDDLKRAGVKAYGTEPYNKNEIVTPNGAIIYNRKKMGICFTLF